MTGLHGVICRRPKCFINPLCIARAYVTNVCNTPIVYIPPKSNVCTFGSPSQSTNPLLRNLNWTVREGEAWAVISGIGGGKGVIFKTLLGHTRIVPPSSEIQTLWAEKGGLYPFLSTSLADPYTRIAHVSFRQRFGAESGAFFDYTARYGAVREVEDRITLRQMLSGPRDELASELHPLFEKLVKDMNLWDLLDLPILTLSNGETRRARIVRSILSRPELLLLDEPFAGLDLPSRQRLNKVLHELHGQISPRVILGLRKGEEIPAWITHVLDVQGTDVFTRENAATFPPTHLVIQNRHSKRHLGTGELIVDLKNVNVSYGGRKVLNNINWQIRQGERWHLRGTNGSGKTTLLALLTGDHPQSFIQDHLLLPSFSAADTRTVTLVPRSRLPTAHLRRLIGVISPEMFDAFPRRHPGMSVWEAITTGFDGGFVPRTRASFDAEKVGGVGWVDVSDEEVDLVTGRQVVSQGGRDKMKTKEEIKQWRIARCWEVLECLGPASWIRTDTGAKEPPSLPPNATRDFASLPFSSLSPGEQRLVLLMRALVGRPPLVLLDEVWSGMDDAMINASQRYLRGETRRVGFNGQLSKLSGVNHRQAAVVITHCEGESPWTGEAVRLFDLNVYVSDT